MIEVFQYPDISFPEGFLWGSSTAGQQVEGNNHSYHDDPETAPDSAFGGHPYEMAGKACNSYERYEDDIRLLKEMHAGIYRMSLEWARIEPEKGCFDTEAMDHYLKVLSRLQEEKIKVCLTLHHFSHPVWFHKQGFFNTLENRKDWETYLEYVVPKVASYVDFWIILNEPNLPFEYTIEQRLNLLEYHAMGYHIVKKYSSKPVSTALAYSEQQPLRGPHDKLDVLVAQYKDYTETEYFLHGIRTGEIGAPFMDAKVVPDLKGTCDFWALNTYVRNMIDGHKSFPMTQAYTASRMQMLDIPYYLEEIHPEIMIDMLMRVKDKPCMITENGCVGDDQHRILYISAMLQGLRQAMDLGADVIGYCHWSLLDNWEWGMYEPNFGLAEVDRTTFDRKIKKSGAFYGEICQKNGFSQEILRKYLEPAGKLK